MLFEKAIFHTLFLLPAAVRVFLHNPSLDGVGLGSCPRSLGFVLFHGKLLFLVLFNA